MDGSTLKLYFMIGLPLENDEDRTELSAWVRKASKWAKGGKITASVSTFVPKSHTLSNGHPRSTWTRPRPDSNTSDDFFQKGRARVKFHNARVSFLEGVLARET